MAYRVFISYSTKDMAIVNKLTEYLQNPSIDVFVAEHSIDAGQPLNQTIENEIKKCQHVIVLWSRNSRDSEFVREEIAIARTHKKRILPIVLDRGLKLPQFISDLKCLPAYQGLVPSLEWTQTYMVKAAQDSEQKNALLVVGAVVVALLLLRNDSE